MIPIAASAWLRYWHNDLRRSSGTSFGTATGTAAASAGCYAFALVVGHNQGHVGPSPRILAMIVDSTFASSGQITRSRSESVLG